MNIEKMNRAMIDAEDRAQNSIGTQDWDRLQGICEGFRRAMSLLGYSWYGQYRGGFRRERKN